MKMLEILEKDRDGLITELTAAKTAERAVVVLENELDKMLIKFNDTCESERERDTAAYMVQAVRLSLPLMDSVGKTRVWESGPDSPEEGRGISLIGILLMLAGLALIGYGVYPLLNVEADLIRCYYIGGGAVVMLASGIFYGKPKKKKKTSKDHQVELNIDAAKVYRSFRTAVLSIDQSLDEVRAAERWNSREKAGEIEGRPATAPELELFSDLMAAAYSRDPEYAMEKLDDIKYFLHRQKIEVVDYSEAHKDYFDMMPGIQQGTIRPALVSEGKLLRKGLASAGR